MSLKIWSVAKRFLKGMISGAMSTVMLVTYKAPTVWSDYSQILNALGLAATFGALTGLILAINKWATWKDEI